MAVGCWMDNVDDSLLQVLGSHIAEGGEAKVYDHGTTLIKTIGLDYFIQPILALDRITLHNTYILVICTTKMSFAHHQVQSLS